MYLRGIITRKAGGIDEKLLYTANMIKSANSPSFITYTNNQTGEQFNFDPTKSFADVIQIIHDYTNVGIGYAYSIEYVKLELVKQGLLI